MKRARNDNVEKAYVKGGQNKKKAFVSGLRPLLQPSKVDESKKSIAKKKRKNPNNNSTKKRVKDPRLALLKEQFRQLRGDGSHDHLLLESLAMDWGEAFVRQHQAALLGAEHEKQKKKFKQQHQQQQQQQQQQHHQQQKKNKKGSSVPVPSGKSPSEIVAWLRPSQAEESRRAETVERLRSVAGCETLTVVGSSAHGLVLPGGDVDVVLETELSLKQLGKHLRRVGTQVMILQYARVPIVKYVDQKTQLPVDVSFSQNGILLNKLLEGILPRFQDLEPLLFLVKCFVSGLDKLNDPSKGGLGSYSIFCLVVSFLQHNNELEELQGDLSRLFRGFMKFWGSIFNSAALGVSLHAGGSFFAKNERVSADFRTALVLEDPLDALNNVSRATHRWLDVRAAFADASTRLESGSVSLASLMSTIKFQRVP